MAECFCGCGRTVRFTHKRASKFGAETDQMHGVLEEVSTPLMVVATWSLVGE